MKCCASMAIRSGNVAVAMFGAQVDASRGWRLVSGLADRGIGQQTLTDGLLTVLERRCARSGWQNTSRVGLAQTLYAKPWLALHEDRDKVMLA